ncbi:MAG TPA: UDP binding domain-containing protein, partial [Microlunatus sp.]|nr:UDP binding domain-containing protein [Microlunatus sp.]
VFGVQSDRALGLDKRIGREHLSPGLGFGGGCFPKDIRALAVRADELGVPTLSGLISSVEMINAAQRSQVAELAVEQLGGDVTGKKVAVLGAAFKPGTDDTRDSPALTVADQLHRHGARVEIYDPQARLTPREGFTQVADVTSAVRDADIVLHLTEWPEFRDLDPAELGAIAKNKIIIDGRLKLPGSAWRAAGWKLVQIGRAATL